MAMIVDAIKKPNALINNPSDLKLAILRHFLDSGYKTYMPLGVKESKKRCNIYPPINASEIYSGESLVNNRNLL